LAKIRVVVLFGGKSSEHSISCATASGVLGAIDKTKYEVIPVGITPDGVFIPVDKDPKTFSLDSGLAVLKFEGKTIRFAMDGSRKLIQIDESGKEESLGVIDVVLPLLHGPFGEDGTIQGFLELASVPYVGNGVLASAVAMDKEFSKALFLASGIPTPKSVVVTRQDLAGDPESALEKIKNLGSLPLFVKPARAGSSVGITKVKDLSKLMDSLLQALEHDEKAIIEVGVSGRELECGVLEGRGDSSPRVSLAGEITVSGREFYDFDAKYVDSDAATLTCPAILTADELAEMQHLALRAFRALGCEGLARVDFFLTKDGFMVNEINTMPGFTSISMFPRCWQASGMDYQDLIDELIVLALEKPVR
jgi:D-alanine-D-alanine ligase